MYSAPSGPGWLGSLIRIIMKIAGSSTSYIHAMRDEISFKPDLYLNRSEALGYVCVYLISPYSRRSTR